LIYFDDLGKRHEIGDVKIMQKGMDLGRIKLKEKFGKLRPNYASLGTQQSYYENLVALGPKVAENILTSLRDAAWNQSIYLSFRNDPAFRTSLMRGQRRLDVRKFSDIAHRRAHSTPYFFEYRFASEKVRSLEFKVVPHALPPTNIQMIIGRNGVGKTRLLKSFLRYLCDGEDPQAGGTITFRTDVDDNETDGTFANLVNVAFSAFDDMSFPESPNGTKTGIKLSYVGLRRPLIAPKLKEDSRGEVKSVTARAKEPKTQLKSIEELTAEFVASFMLCKQSSRSDQWLQVIKTLETDPVFASMQLANMIEMTDESAPIEAAKLFSLASSGHKIVLLCMTRLVELVEERTLVLIDEPEAHLHPPLQSSFIRALSQLLTARNGVGVLATHSPVMLQEVPRDCVWLLYRDIKNVEAQRPQVQTFAENLGVLTREVFRVEATSSGFHALLNREIDAADSFEDVLARFSNQVGAEGRAIARTLWKARTETDSEVEA